MKTRKEPIAKVSKEMADAFGMNDLPNVEVEFQHTPTPWHVGMKPGPMIYGELGEQIADCRGLDEAGHNALFIVRAVNSHDELLEALITALPYVETALEDAGYKSGVVDRMLKQIHNAIAKAEGR